ncbi:MAG: ATP-binding protein [Mycobacterium sp.]
MRGNAADKVDWLQNEWIPSGPPVCVLSGFSGTGKSAVCHHVIDNIEMPCAYIPLSEDLGFDDFVLTLAGELEVAGLPQMANDADSDMLTSLSGTQSTPQLLVIDDFDYLIDGKTGLPPARFVQFIKSLSRNTSTKLRLLLIIDRIIPESIWEMDQVTTTVLNAPGRDEACEWLTEILAREGLGSELSEVDKIGVAQWLGGNFSAMGSFVQCLRYESIDELILLDPEGWELREQVVSQRLIESLERKFVDRTLARLDQNSKSLLEFLSVYRRPFRSDAIERLASEVIDAKDVRDELTSRFLLDRRRNWYSMNSIIRELCTKSIGPSSRRKNFAHNRAADHYVRHFKNVNPNQSLTSHSMEFVEARYHLWFADRIDEFEDVAGNFRRQIIRSLGPNPRLPREREERMQLLTMINGALAGQQKDYHVLRGVLAKLLMERNWKDDDTLALRHLRVAVQQSHDPETWRMYVQLTARLDGARTAETVARRGFTVINSQHHANLYDSVVEAYRREDMVPDAIRFLDEGLQSLDISAQIFLSPVLGRLLSRSGRSAEAVRRLITIYQQAVAAGGSNAPYYWRPIEQALFIAHGQGDAASFKYIEQSIVPSDFADSFRFLVLCLSHQLSGNYRAAAEVAREHSTTGSKRSPALAGQEAFSWLCCGEVGEAESAISKISLPNNAASTWLRACVYYSAGRLELCREMVEELEKRELDISDSDIPGHLVSIWNEAGGYGNVHPAFYFPNLPSSLTGLDRDLRRSLGNYTALGGVDPRNVWFPRRVENDVEVQDEPAHQAVHHPLVAIQVGGSVAEYNVGQAGAVGDGAVANNPVFVQGSVDPLVNQLPALANELRTLRAAMASQARTDEEFASLNEIEAAIESADRQDVDATRGRLASAGSWALGVAASIGGGLALAALKSALGLG